MEEEAIKQKTKEQMMIYKKLSKWNFYKLKRGKVENMRYEGMTKREACGMWVSESNAFPVWMIEKVAGEYFDGIRKIATPLFVGDTVFYKGESCEIKEINEENETITIMNDDEEIRVSKNKIEKEEYTFFPSWSTMWEFSNIKEKQAKLVAKCGFDMYKLEEDGTILIGIDGGGCDFFDEYWLPLYDAMNMRWHDEATEKENVA